MRHHEYLTDAEIEERAARKGKRIGALGQIRTPEESLESVIVVKARFYCAYTGFEHQKINAIKALRSYDPSLSLKEAKDFVEGTAIEAYFYSQNEAMVFAFGLNSNLNNLPYGVVLDSIVSERLYV